MLVKVKGKPIGKGDPENLNLIGNLDQGLIYRCPEVLVSLGISMCLH